MLKLSQRLGAILKGAALAGAVIGAGMAFSAAPAMAQHGHGSWHGGGGWHGGWHGGHGFRGGYWHGRWYGPGWGGWGIYGYPWPYYWGFNGDPDYCDYYAYYYGYCY